MKKSFSSYSQLFLEFPVFFFVPYLVVYLVGWFFSLPSPQVADIFLGLHGLTLLFVIIFLGKEWRHIQWYEGLFWLGLAILLCKRGAYLEYPSDAWEHFRRLTVWNDYKTISENPLKTRFAYFWGWSLIRFFNPLQQRTFLHFYSAFWQWLFCYQFARFFYRLGITRLSLIPQVLGTLVFFGSGMMSFRYYMLSSVPLGYLAYLSAVQFLLEFLETKKKILLMGLTLFLFLMGLNHPETALFFFLTVLSLLIWEQEKKTPFLKKKITWEIFVLVFCVSCVLGVFLNLMEWFPFNKYLHSDFWRPQLTDFAFFRVWDPDGRIFETVAVPGILALIGSWWVRKSYPRVVLMSWVPLLCLLFPLSSILIVRFFHFDTPYRVLYAFPLSVILVLLLEKIMGKFLKEGLVKSGVVSLLVVCLALPYQYPWRGRAFFQIHRPKPERELVFLDQTAQWFLENRKKFDESCYLYGDDFTLFSLFTHLGWKRHHFDRVNPSFFIGPTAYKVSAIRSKIYYLNKEGQRMCGVLLARDKEIPPPQPSIVSLSGKLWPPERGDLKNYTAGVLEALIPIFKEEGWSKTEVPPFYDLYEPPWEPMIQ